MSADDSLPICAGQHATHRDHATHREAIRGVIDVEAKQFGTNYYHAVERM